MPLQRRSCRAHMQADSILSSVNLQADGCCCRLGSLSSGGGDVSDIRWWQAIYPSSLGRTFFGTVFPKIASSPIQARSTRGREA